jgi:hypothetical protein
VTDRNASLKAIDAAMRRISAVIAGGLRGAREQLIAEIVGKMPESHRKLLMSLKKGEPEWKLLGVDGAEALPAVR